MPKQIVKIVVSGGPGAGKTTGMAVVRQYLEDLGWTVITPSEAATDYLAAGFTPELLGERFQSGLFEHLMGREDFFSRQVELIESERIVVLFDRGALDAKAYVDGRGFDLLLSSNGWTESGLLSRYDGVIILRSPAVDKPEAYTCANNACRRETPEVAKLIDERTLQSWLAHPHLQIVGNEGDFHHKISRVCAAVCRVLGIPEPIEIEEKFLVKNFFPALLPLPHQLIKIAQHYLTSTQPGVQERVRKRVVRDVPSYFHTIKEDRRVGVRAEREKQISKKEYDLLLGRADPSCGVIVKKRYCFVWRNQRFELDVFAAPAGLVILEVELTTEQDEVVLPDFLAGRAVKVTGDKQYYNRAIAERLAQECKGR